MKKTALRYGAFSMAALIVASVINYLVNKGPDNYARAEVGGYLAMVVSMVFVYFGMRQYRDQECGGSINYWQAFKVGFLITLLPALAFGVFDIIYVLYLDPRFMDSYYTHATQQLQAAYPPDVYQAKLKELQQQKELFSNPILQFLLMSSTVLIIGVVVTALSALVLQRRPKEILAS